MGRTMKSAMALAVKRLLARLAYPGACLAATWLLQESRDPVAAHTGSSRLGQSADPGVICCQVSSYSKLGWRRGMPLTCYSGQFQGFAHADSSAGFSVDTRTTRRRISLGSAVPQ